MTHWNEYQRRNLHKKRSRFLRESAYAAIEEKMMIRIITLGVVIMRVLKKYWNKIQKLKNIIVIIHLKTTKHINFLVAANRTFLKL